LQPGSGHPDESRESTSDANGTTTRSKSETRTENVCPVSLNTTSFGVVQPSGEYVAFDQPSSERVVEMVRKHHRWHEYITEKKPIAVRVVGTPNGKVIVVREIQ
jgi:hypothetical protein